MPVHNADISKLFRRLSDLLEIEGANPFRIRAYRNAAQTIDDLPRSAAGMIEAGEDLTRLPGIGADLASKINEISGTGRLAALEEVEARTPSTLAALTSIPGLGPKRVHTLYETLGIFAQFFPGAELPLLFDVSHNTCKVEPHLSGRETRQLYIHRKGATRAFAPNHPGLPHDLKPFGQPVLIGGSMSTASYVLAGATSSEERAFSSACHGAGRQMSRNQALKNWSGRQIVDELKGRGIIVKSPSQRGVAEEAPGADKDVDEVVDAAEMAGLAKKVAKLTPVICIKG